MRVTTAPLGSLPPYKYIVVFARMNGQWLYARHKQRGTWETAGGHIEPGEAPEQAARRELYEETGAVDFSFSPAFDYAVDAETSFANGRVYLAEINRLGPLPAYEMAETRLFESIPGAMTYPQILPVLYQRLQMDWKEA